MGISNINLIQNRFSKASNNYINGANIQKTAARKILSNIPNYYNNGLILDIGSGPGTTIHAKDDASLSLIKFDLSLAMLKQSLDKRDFCINGDAHSLPFAKNSISLIISNLMLQWAHHKLNVIKEIHHALRSSSYALITTLIQPSLWQLQAAWKCVDSYPHTLDFLTDVNYLDMFHVANFKVVHYEFWEEIHYFSDVLKLLRHFKTTGTNMAKIHHKQGIGGKHDLITMTRAYECHRTKQGLPLSYHYAYFVVMKD